MKVSEIINSIEEVAPRSLQENYDNAGVQIGSVNRECNSALLCIDVTEEVIDEAISLGINLVISHHPLLFKGLKAITGNGYIERIVIKAIKNDITIYAAHTNLDNAFYGVNDKIAEKIGLTNNKILSPLENRLLKIVTFVPLEQADQVKNAMYDAGAGSIGNYDRCSFTSEGYGTFRAGESSHPFCGYIGTEHTEKEVRLEMILPDFKKTTVIKALLSSHPYEEPAFDIIELQNSWQKAGSGVIGDLPEEMDTIQFLKKLKTLFSLTCLKHSRILKPTVRRIALCGGAGSFLMKDAINSNADVFITGEIKYHDYFGNDENILLAELGHYESEQYTKDIFSDIITKKFPTFATYYTKVETNPINYL